MATVTVPPMTNGTFLPGKMWHLLQIVIALSIYDCHCFVLHSLHSFQRFEHYLDLYYNRGVPPVATLILLAIDWYIYQS